MQQDSYLEIKKTNNLPRLPLEGGLDLTYRCNNNCRHCWLRISPQSKEKKKELSFGEIKDIVNKARAMGCLRWSISGGEPMLRPDFPELFDYITRNSNSYSLNTNGTLITPKIAKLLKRKGTKMVVLYGATAQVHDHITRSPGSFEAVMRGFRYLKEAGIDFIVQLLPMRDNYYQFKEMVSLAESLSKHYRIGTAWLYLSASGNREINIEIMRQRLPPQEVIELDNPDLSFEEWVKNEQSPGCCNKDENGCLFASCVNTRINFHIDPYGKMTFCSFIKEPSLRYDLRKGSFREAWEEFIPSLASRIKATREYRENCGSCKIKKYCRWCPAYGYLEHRRFSAKVNYLCAVAKESRKFRDNWEKNHRRYFNIAGITIQVESDLPITENTFHPKFNYFKVNGRGKDTISIRHHFSLPDFNIRDLGKELYRKPPWAIYKKGDAWIYLGISSLRADKSLHRVAIFNHDYSRGMVYNDDYRKEIFLKGNLDYLTFFSDQILLTRVLADRKGCYLHSCGVNFDGKGLLFVGHSEAGKSTMATMLKGKAEILCDDRMIVRGRNNGFRIYGTWSHGEVSDVSANSVPLKAIMFLEKADETRLIPLKDKKEITRRLLACLIKPFVSVDWWDKMLTLVGDISDRTPCYVLKFDKSGKAVELFRTYIL